MKSVFFNKPLEFNIDILGDNWKQGDKVEGTVSIKNHSGEEVNLDEYGIFLCNANAKKIKANDPKGLEVVGEKIFDNLEDNKFSFDLCLNSPITEKSSGPYIVCAKKDDLLSGQHLIMQVTPGENASKAIEILENFLRFKVKTVKSKKSGIEYTLNIPNSKEYSSISSFKILVEFNEKNLKLKYQFKTKKISYEAGNTTTKDEAKTFKYELTPSEYLFYGESVDQDKMIKHFNEVLEQVKLKPII
jgi:hypothetical protein